MIPLTLIAPIGVAFATAASNKRAANQKAEAKREAAKDKREFRQKMTLLEAQAQLAREGINPDDIDAWVAASAVAEDAEKRGANIGQLSNLMSALKTGIEQADEAGVDDTLRALLTFAGIPIPPDMSGIFATQVSGAAISSGADVSQDAPLSLPTWAIAIPATLLTALILALLISNGRK